ncbi:MAG: hypothetical protein IT445_02995 [Phycisphaeraceae bacterium]|nr:hypothetical protein [Phycisphaeraceae bacterium]
MRKKSMLRNITSVANIIAIGFCFHNAALGADDMSLMSADGADSSWHFDLKTWTWLLGVEGTIGVGPLNVEADANFGDILEASDSLLAFSGRIEAGKGPFTGFVDGMWAKIGADNRTGPLGFSNVDITSTLGIVDFGLMYRIYEGDLLGANQPVNQNSTVNIYGGARYITIGLELDPATLASRNADKDWIDPIVGVKLTQPLTDRVDMELWGDIGGFGSSSDITWSATAVVGYDFTMFDMPMTVYGGYRAISWDYSDGSGPGAFQWDVILHGPTIGLKVWF